MCVREEKNPFELVNKYTYLVGLHWHSSSGMKNNLIARPNGLVEYNIFGFYVCLSRWWRKQGLLFIIRLSGSFGHGLTATSNCWPIIKRPFYDSTAASHLLHTMNIPSEQPKVVKTMIRHSVRTSHHSPTSRTALRMETLMIKWQRSMATSEKKKFQIYFFHLISKT